MKGVLIILTFKSKSEAETKKIGEKIGKKIKPPCVVLLSGELGAGKTTFVKGLARGLGFKKEADVSSPTFSLIHEYPNRVKLFHIDWYRMDKVKGEDAEMAKECFYENAVTFVEWPERGEKIWPEKYIKINLKHESPGTRVIQIKSVGVPFK